MSKKGTPCFIIDVEYNGDKVAREVIEHVARGEDGGSGYSFITGLCDISFEYKTKKAAENSLRRLKREFGKRIKAELYDEERV